MPKTSGYHYAGTVDGALAVEVDIPCEGSVTLTWKPQEYPGKSGSMELPQDLFLAVVNAYIAERKLPKIP